MLAQNRESVWPQYDLLYNLKNAKISKKVFLVDRFRNEATLTAIRLAALLQRGEKSADFSSILSNSISSLINVDLIHFKQTRRQPQQYNQVPSWRYLNQELEATLYQISLFQHEDKVLIPFTLNLTPEFTSKAIQKNFLDYTKRQLDKAFLKVLKRKPQYWFIVEFTTMSGTITKGQQRPHIHGSILLFPHELESIRKQKSLISKAFHEAIGKTSNNFNNRLFESGSYELYAQQNQISQLEAAIGWVSYCHKHQTFARIFLKTSSTLTADNLTKREAKTLHEQLSRKRQKPNINPEFEALLAELAC